MKFIVDAHLPKRLARHLATFGHDVLHTLDLPQKNEIKDKEIIALSMTEERIVITKDEDFVNTFVLKRQPYKLLLVSTGNISNNELITVFSTGLTDIITAFMVYDFIEIDKTNLIIHI